MRLVISFLILTSMFLHGEAKAETAREYVQEGVRFMNEQQYDDAIEAFLAALELKSDMWEIHNALGVAYMKIDKSFYNVLSSFEKALKYNPEYAEAFFNIGLAYAQYHDDSVTSQHYFEKAVSVDPGYVKAYHALGMIYLTKKHDAAKASGMFEKTIELKPDLAEAYFGLGMSYIAEGQVSKALTSISTLRTLGRQDLALVLEAMARGENIFATQEKPGREEIQANLNADE